MGVDWSEREGTYSAKHAYGFMQDVHRMQQETISVVHNLSYLAAQLTSARARTFANEGVGRRLRVIERCVLNVFDIFPPDRKTFLSLDECDDVAIQLHAFAINVSALFDNLAWIVVLEAGLVIPPMDVGLYKKACRSVIPQRLSEYVNATDLLKWHFKFGKPYRDATAHRIPLYLPSREYTEEEGTLWKQLDTASMRELLTYKPGDEVDARLARHEELERQKHALGRNSKLMALSLCGEDAEAPVYMHPQLLCDWALANDLVRVGTQSIREANGWPEPVTPVD
jgi:hypothetical protein